MQSKSIILLIFFMAGVTYLTRILHVFIPMDRIPQWFRDIMHLIPVVIIAAIVSTSVFVHNGQIQLLASSGYIAAISLTVIAYIVTKSSGGAVIIGLGTHVLIKLCAF